MDKPPYLQLVDHSTSAEHDEEFLPLPFYPWDERPQNLELEFDELATAIHLGGGSLAEASRLLKTPIYKINRAIKRSPRLARIFQESFELTTRRAESEVIAGLDAPDDRRREWAASKILASKAAQNSQLAPAPTGQSSTAASLTLNQENRTLTFRWRTDADTTPADELDDDARTIEG